MYASVKIYKIVNRKKRSIYRRYLCGMFKKKHNIEPKEDIYQKKKTMRPLYNCMRAHGIENCFIGLIEMFPSNTCDELRAREGYYIKQLGTLNQRAETRTDKAD